MKNHLSTLPEDIKKRLHGLIEKQFIIDHLEGGDNDKKFLLHILSWLQLDDPKFPPSPDPNS